MITSSLHTLLMACKRRVVSRASAQAGKVLCRAAALTLPCCRCWKACLPRPPTSSLFSQLSSICGRTATFQARPLQCYCCSRCRRARAPGLTSPTGRAALRALEQSSSSKFDATADVPASLLLHLVWSEREAALASATARLALDAGAERPLPVDLTERRTLLYGIAANPIDMALGIAGDVVYLATGAASACRCLLPRCSASCAGAPTGTPYVCSDTDFSTFGHPHIITMRRLTGVKATFSAGTLPHTRSALGTLCLTSRLLSQVRRAAAQVGEMCYAWRLKTAAFVGA